MRDDEARGEEQGAVPSQGGCDILRLGWQQLDPSCSVLLLVEFNHNQQLISWLSSSSSAPNCTNIVPVYLNRDG